MDKMFTIQKYVTEDLFKDGFFRIVKEKDPDENPTNRGTDAEKKTECGKDGRMFFHDAILGDGKWVLLLCSKFFID
jgi:hypothetical protein